MYKVKLNETDLQTISRFGKLAMIGKYSHRRQWVNMNAYRICLRERRRMKEKR